MAAARVKSPMVCLSSPFRDGTGAGTKNRSFERVGSMNGIHPHPPNDVQQIGFSASPSSSGRGEKFHDLEFRPISTATRSSSRGNISSTPQERLRHAETPGPVNAEMKKQAQLLERSLQAVTEAERSLELREQEVCELLARIEVWREESARISLEEKALREQVLTSHEREVAQLRTEKDFLQRHILDLERGARLLRQDGEGAVAEAVARAEGELEEQSALRRARLETAAKLERNRSSELERQLARAASELARKGERLLSYEAALGNVQKNFEQQGSRVAALQSELLAERTEAAERWKKKEGKHERETKDLQQTHERERAALWAAEEVNRRDVQDLLQGERERRMSVENTLREVKLELGRVVSARTNRLESCVKLELDRLYVELADLHDGMWAGIRGGGRGGCVVGRAGGDFISAGSSCVGDGGAGKIFDFRGEEGTDEQERGWGFYQARTDETSTGTFQSAEDSALRALKLTVPATRGVFSEQTNKRSVCEATLVNLCDRSAKFLSPTSLLKDLKHFQTLGAAEALVFLHSTVIPKLKQLFRRLELERDAFAMERDTKSTRARLLRFTTSRAGAASSLSQRSSVSTCPLAGALPNQIMVGLAKSSPIESTLARPGSASDSTTLDELEQENFVLRKELAATRNHAEATERKLKALAWCRESQSIMSGNVAVDDS